MDHPINCTPLVVTAHRLLDFMQARPRSLAEFEKNAAQAAGCVRAALRDAPARRRGAGSGWPRLAARLGRTLHAAGPKDPACLRLTSEMICLPRLCERSACRKARMCRDTPRACLKRSAPRVPEMVRIATVALAERIERGDTLNLAVALLPFESKMALWAWQRAQADMHENGA